MKKNQIAITLGIVCFILTIAICIQVKTIKNTTSTVALSFEEDELRDEVLRWKEKYDYVYEELEKSEKNLNAVRERAMQNTEQSTEVEEELKLNNMLLGMTDVTGSGVIITLKDNSNVTAESVGPTGNISLYLIHADDIKTMINELKNAGAEAISVNDQRVVSTTSITCEGNVISMNNQKIGTPYVIKAIGSQDLLYGAISRPGGYLELINSGGAVGEIKKATNLSILKYNGVINAKIMQISEER